MNDLMMRYIECFLHPKLTQQGLRPDNNTVSLFGNSRERKLSFEDCLGVSWFYTFIQAFYALLIIYLGIEFFRLEDEVVLITKQNKSIVKIFFVILEVVLFPIAFWFYTKFWSNIISLFCRLFDREDIADRGQSLVIHAMSCHVLLIFPFFGKVFTQVAQAIYIYQGLRINLGFNVYQSLAVLIFPLFLIFISFTLIIISLAMLFAGF
jgi:hypothetical protein